VGRKRRFKGGEGGEGGGSDQRLLAVGLGVDGGPPQVDGAASFDGQGFSGDGGGKLGQKIDEGEEI
jgi:hypothetical protein